MLASSSPRRAQILAELGLPFEVVSAGVDDGDLSPPPTATAASWTVSMAYLKARAAIDQLPAGACGVVLGADTSCELDGQIIGKPADSQEASRMLHLMSGRTQRVVTGVALVNPNNPQDHRLMVTDVAMVTFGPLEGTEIDRYVETNGWQGKAGGYNLAERIADGWAITVEGDPDTVVGLPTQRLTQWLEFAARWEANA